MTDYLLKEVNMELNAQASNANVAITLLDNSVDFGNIPVRVVKLKAASLWGRNVVDQRTVILSVYRQTEGATALDLDDAATVKNATQAGQFYRRPFMSHTNIAGFGDNGEMDHMRKPLILENLLLDDDDDVIFALTNAGPAFAASSQLIEFRLEAWWKRV